MATTGLSDRFAAHIHGDGSRTVVFGNGFATDQSVWRPQVTALVAAGYRAITYDAAGATPHTLALYQPERHRILFGFAEDLAALMQSLKVSHASYVGHSVAGMVGILAANGQSDLFDTVTLIGGSACYIDDPATAYVGGFSREQIAGLIASMRSDYASWANGFASLVAANPDRPHLALEFTQSLMALRPDIAIAVLETVFLSDLRADAMRVSHTTQVIQTARDPAVPLAAAQWLAQATRAADFQVIDTEGHFPHISAPEAVSSALLGFLDAHVPH